MRRSNDAAGVDICPSDSIHRAKGEAGFPDFRQLCIHPDQCIDCLSVRRALSGALLLIVVRRLGVPLVTAAFVGGGCCFALRVVAATLNGNLPRIANPQPTVKRRRERAAPLPWPCGLWFLVRASAKGKPSAGATPACGPRPELRTWTRR